MKSGTRRRQPWLKDFIVFMFLMSFQNSHAVANTPLPSRTSQTTLDLQQRPIPPVTPAENLNAPYLHDASIKTLDEAVKLMAKYKPGREMPDQDIKYIVAFLKTLPGVYKGLPLMTGYSPRKQDKAP